MVFNIKLRGFVNISDDEDINHIKQAFNIFGEQVDADQLVKYISTEISNEKVEFEFPKDPLENTNDTKSSYIRTDVRIRKQKKASLKVKDKCGECKYYSERGAIRAHIFESHGEENSSRNIGNGNGIKQEVVKPEGIKEYIKTKPLERIMDGTCYFCKLKGIPRGGLVTHVKNIHPDREILKCKTCGYECLFKSSLANHASASHRPQTTCRFCQKTVKQIEYHLEKFHPEELELYPCAMCTFSAYSEQKLANHIRKQHESKRGHCVKCEKRFKNIANHMKKHKTNKFECIPCSKMFSLKRDLCRHILYNHEKKRSYCKTCGNTSVTNLKQHMKRRHPEMDIEVVDDERIHRDRIWAELGDAWQYMG